AAPFPFAARGRIDDAAYPVVARAPAPAHLIAGQAAADVLRSARRRLVGKMRIWNLAADDRDEVGTAVAPYAFGTFGRANVALGRDQRVANRGFDRRGKICAELLGIQEGRHDLVEVEIAAGAAGYIVHEFVAVVAFDDFGQRLPAQRHFHVRLVIDCKADDEIVAAYATNATHHLAAHARAVLQASAPAVVAPV